jgi:hypothetical protein
MKVLGLDLSIAATGLTHTVQGAPCTHVIKTRDKDGDARLSQIRRSKGQSSARLPP